MIIQIKVHLLINNKNKIKKIKKKLEEKKNLSKM
jgi:hypothetical protein